MNNPFFSVIIPSYNRIEVLPRAIDSVLKQSYENFELIIVDDGSTDQTSEYLSQLKDSRIKTVFQENKGVATARNKGSQIAQGKWLAFLDSDDEWLEHKLSSQYNYINNHRNVPLVHGEELWVRNGKRVNPKKKHQKAGGDQFQRSLELCVISPSTAVINKDIFKEIGLFDPNFIVCEDYDLWLRLTCQYLVGFISDPLIIKYGGHKDQLSRKYKAMDYYRVRSMVKLLNDNKLNDEKKSYVLLELEKKVQILNLGYQKHGQFKAILELKELLNAVNLGHLILPESP